VRERYAAAATSIAAGAAAVDPMAEPTDASCCGSATAAGSSCCAPIALAGNQVFGGTLYTGQDDAEDAPVQASLGRGVPTGVSDLRDGDVVLDLGSGAGADVLISARRVAPTGRAIGLDMTDEMLALARANAAGAGITNAEFIKGYLEELPLPDGSLCELDDAGSRLRRTPYRSMTISKASSTLLSSAADSMPALSPSRWASTVLICSHSTLVRCPATTISGRNVAARATVEVGTTTTVFSSERSSLCTTTA